MVNDKNHLFTNADITKDRKVLDKIRTQQQFSRFSVTDVNAINQSSSSAAPVALQIDTKPRIGDPINDTIGSIGLITQIIFLDVFGSNYSTMTITDDVTFAFDKIPQGRHIAFTIDFVINTGTPPIITLDSRVINPPTLPTLTNGLRVVLNFIGVVDDTDTRFTYIGGTVDAGGGGEFFGPWTADHDAGGFSLNNILSLDIEDSAGATKLSISGPLGVGARFSFVSGDSVFFTENITDRLKINSGGLDILSGDVIGVDRLQFVQDAGALISPSNPTIYVDNIGAGDLVINNVDTEAIIFTHSNIIGFQLSQGAAQLQVDKATTTLTRFRQYLFGAVPSLGVSIGDHLFSANRTTGGLTDFAFVTGLAEDVGNTTFEGGMVLQVARLGNLTPEVFIRLNSGKNNLIDMFREVDMNNNKINAINPTTITDLTLVTAATGDFVWIIDATDGLSKKVNASDFLGAGSQTPWLLDIDADGFDLKDLSNIEFRVSTGAPLISTPSIWNSSVGINYNVPTGKIHTFQINGTDTVIFDTDEIRFQSGRAHKIVAAASALQIVTENTNDDLQIFTGAARSNVTVLIEDLKTSFFTTSSQTSAYALQIIQNNTTPATFRTIANIDLIAENTISIDTIYARISVSSQNVTSGAERGLLQLGVVSGGTLITGIDIEGSSSGGVNDALIGFFGETPVVQQSVASDTLANLYTALRNLGLIV